MIPPTARLKPDPPSEATMPYRNSATSLPSRRTATPTTTANATSALFPSETACPTARISPAISLPCRAIQTLCQVNIITATLRIAALNSSCPIPANSWDKAPANAATTQAASAPASTPPTIQRLRCGTEPVTASTMPIINPASKTSRKTMMSAASIGARLLHDQGAARLFVEVVVKFVAPGFQCPHIDDALAVGGDHLFDPQRFALKLHGFGVEVLDPESEGFVGGGAHLARLELAVGIAHLNLRRLLRVRGRYRKQRNRANSGERQFSHRDQHSRLLSAFTGVKEDQNS